MQLCHAIPCPHAVGAPLGQHGHSPAPRARIPTITSHPQQPPPLAGPHSCPPSSQVTHGVPAVRTRRRGWGHAAAAAAAAIRNGVGESTREQELLSAQQELQGLTLPKHLAVIMDGNARWAQARGMPVTKGHEQGGMRFKELVDTSRALGLKALTVYAFSQENWKRGEHEVGFILNTISDVLDTEVEKLKLQGVRLDFVGDISSLPPSLQAQVSSAQRATCNNTDMVLTVALSYSSQQDVAAAARRIARLAAQGLLDPDKVDADMLQGHLSTAPVLSDVGSPDLLIRTSGEQRLSNFLLFEIAYCELYFSKVHWPDFSARDLCEALKEYCRRQRRYGGRLRNTNDV